jgi:hypothetical protein
MMNARDEQLQRKFVNGVLAPLARSGRQEDYELLLDFLGLLKDIPADRRKAVRDALRKTADAAGSREDLERRLGKAGLKRSSGIFGLGGKQDV